MIARWRILLTSIKASVEKTQGYVLACLALHNYLRQTNNALHKPASFMVFESSDGALIWALRRSDIPENSNGALQVINYLRGARYTDESFILRDDLKDYFNSENGSVSL